MPKKEETDDGDKISKLAKFMHVLLLEHMTLDELMEVIDESVALTEYDIRRDKFVERSFTIAAALAKKLR
jgi:hypothetical protein